MTETRAYGQVAFITGARGIGRALALRLAASGAAVIVAARTAHEVSDTVSEISQRGGKAIGVDLDVTSESSVESAFAAAETKFGSVSILINNAGAGAAVGPIWEVDPAVWWNDVEVNLRGTFLCCRRAVPRMIESRAGRIVNISTYSAIKASPYHSAYAASKAGVVKFSEGLAESLAPYRIPVFVVSPGNVKTQMMDTLLHSPEGTRWLPHLQALDADQFHPQDAICDLVSVMVSGAADALTGRFIHVDDDIQSLMDQAERIVAGDLYTLRLRK
jgi:NAD(P)-dependent dehydrogenase (short-subunit alcohol dehydrogenase family)